VAWAPKKQGHIEDATLAAPSAADRARLLDIMQGSADLGEGFVDFLIAGR
jgi:hypothetical protein